VEDAVEWIKTEEAAENARAVVVVSLIEKEEKSGVSHSDLHTNFDRAIKRFILAYHAGVSIVGLRGKERRDGLEEELTGCVLETVKYAKALEDPELRLKCLP
jgi:hypothetical protein